MMKNPDALFDAIRTIAGPLNQREVDLINQALIDAESDAPAKPKARAKKSGGRDVTPDGIARLHQREGCKLTAYPDPGSRDGTPWTIGYGATGPGIKKGVKWTQGQADARFEADLRRFEDQVERVLGDCKTSQAQFDALVSFSFNVGISAFGKSTLLRYHKQGAFAGAADQFGRWVFNDGKRMMGLTNRRRGEAAQYAGKAS